MLFYKLHIVRIEVCLESKRQLGSALYALRNVVRERFIYREWLD